MSIRLLKLLIIPLLFTLGYFILAQYPYFFSKINRYDSLGPLSLVEEKSVNIQRTVSSERSTDQFDNHLFKGEKITAKFKSSENNFGILLLRFAKLAPIVSDKIVFRLKEDGKENWHYENNYEAKQFQDNQYFTFGFPPIENSKNKSYVFEIESLAGTYKNGVGVSLKEPQVALVYKYSRNELKGFNTLSSFIFKKFVYAARNINLLTNWQILATFVSSLLLILFLRWSNIKISDILGFLQILTIFFLFIFVIFMGKIKIFKKKFKRTPMPIVGKIKSNYLLQKSHYLSLEKKIVDFLKRLNHWFASTNVYLKFFNTNTKKRLAIGILLFLLALTYRFSSSLVDQEGVTLFYAGLGSQGDYDQFIRAATCAIRSFCPAILGQNFLFESSILGVFYGIFGFIGGLKAYLYLMLTLGSFVATLPYILLSRKNWFSLGGIFGGLFLATSDFLTHMSLNFPPDNGSLFTFSMFYIVYFLTLQARTLRWLLFFGFIGAIDALNKALFILNDLVALGIFAPVYIFEKAMKKGKLIFRKENIKILFLSLLPLLVFFTIYSAWEFFVYIKFSAYYFLGGLIITGGKNYVYYTSANDASLAGNIIFKLFYLATSAVIMLKNLIEYSGFNMYLLGPIFLGMLTVSFVARNFSVKRFVLFFVFSILIFFLLALIKNNYYKVHEVFNAYNISTWTYGIYLNLFLFIEIVLLFILKFKYSTIKLTLPIIPYVIMLIILTKNSPFPRLHTHVVFWSAILLAFIIDFLMVNINMMYSKKSIKVIPGLLLVTLFIYVYMLPKMATMATRLASGIYLNQNQVRYLRWVEGSIPANAILLAGGKSDLVTVGENIQRPIIYNSLYSAAVLVKPDELPGIKPEDFGITGVRFLYQGRMRIPKVGESDFSITSELTNKNNFNRNKYIILEDDIEIWRSRVSGIADNVFSTTPGTLHANDYSIKIYKSNSTLKKAIYELIVM